ncbi:hypothetical protein Tco_1302138 [Tanacetum coccineum]
MASFDYHLNPFYTIKECSSCGALYTTGYYCSKWGLVDKIVRDPNKTPDSSQRPPQNCARYGNPVDGPYFRGCALLRKKFKEDLFTYCVENGIFQDLQDTSESSNDNTNVVNAPQEPFVVKQDPGENSSQSPPHIDHNCCYESGDSLDDIFCQRCTCKSCGKDGNSFTYDFTPNFVNDSPNIFNPPPQPQYVPYSCELCGNDAHHGYDCPPQVPFVYNQDPCFNQNFDYFPQTSPSFPQQYPCCEDCGGPHETFQCQPMNYYEPNPCYDSNYSGFDQFQPPQYTVNHPIFNAQNELLNSQNEIMEQMTSICDMVGQYMQKKEEDKRIAEDQAAKDRYWKIPICYDDDDDEESSIPLKDIIISGLPSCVAITPALLTKEPVDSLIMEDEHLDTIPATESDEVIKSSIENLVQTPSEFEGIPDSVCDMPLCNNPTPLEAFKEHSEIVIDFNDDSTSSDDDFYPKDEYIDYVEHILRCEIVSQRWWSLLYLKLEGLIRYSSNTHKMIVFISSGSTTTRSLPNYEAFYLDDDHIEEKSSGSTTTHADFSQYDSFIFDLSINPFPPTDRSDFYHEEFVDELAHIISPSEYDCFYFKSEPDPGELTSIVDSEIRENVLSTTNVNLPFEDDQSPLLAYVVWIFLPFLMYPVNPPYLLSYRNEDTIFDPGISVYHSFMPSVSHRSGTFMKFNVYPSQLNESPIEILSSTCSPMDQ